MVCSNCGIRGHNKRTCNEVLINNKVNKLVVSKNIKKMLYKIDDIDGKENRVKECKHMLNYILFHKWFLIKHKLFYNIVLLKCKEIKNNKIDYFPEIDKYVNKFSKIIKKINTNECPICFEELGKINVCTTICGHSFCMICMVRHLKNNSMCPLCKEKMSYPIGL